MLSNSNDRPLGYPIFCTDKCIHNSFMFTDTSTIIDATDSLRKVTIESNLVLEKCISFTCFLIPIMKHLIEGLKLKMSSIITSNHRQTVVNGNGLLEIDFN